MYVCLFDIDGTLLASGGAGKAAMETALLEEFGLTALCGRVPFSGRTDRAIGRDLFAMHDVPDRPENWRRFLEGYLKRLPACLHQHAGRVLPGIAELLDSLAQRDDVTLGLLTGNVREGARLKLEHYDLYRHFSFGGFGDEHLCRDDVAREALAAARAHLNGGLEVDRIWVIGDTPFDVQCARAIGARVAAVATGWHSLEELSAARPDVVLSDFADARPFFSQW